MEQPTMEQSDHDVIVRLAGKVDGLISSVGEVKSTIQSFNLNYVPQQVFELRLRELDLASKQLDLGMKSITLRLEKLENKRNVPIVIISGIVGIICSAFTFLLIAWIQGFGKT